MILGFNARIIRLVAASRGREGFLLPRWIVVPSMVPKYEMSEKKGRSARQGGHGGNPKNDLVGSLIFREGEAGVGHSVTYSVAWRATLAGVGRVMKESTLGAEVLVGTGHDCRRRCRRSKSRWWMGSSNTPKSLYQRVLSLGVGVPQHSW